VLNNLQTLRAIAAYSVVIYHCLMRFVRPEGPIGMAYLDLPSGGVDLFFVISGFVMVHTTRDDETPGWFATKRIARIVPLYWVATFVVIGLVLVREWLFPTTLVTPESILASLFFVPHLDAAGHVYPILGVGWTLNYEMMFYALFAISLFLPRAFRLASILALITLVWVIAMIGGDSVFTRFYANPIIFEFAAGCSIAYALRAPAVIAFVRATPMWPLALAGFAALVILPSFIGEDVATFFKYGIPAMFIVFAAAAQDLYRAPAATSMVTRLGDASYSAYLLHPIVIAIVAQVVLLVAGDGPLAEGLILAATLVATAVISTLSMKYFEKPTAALVRNLVRRPRKVAGAERASPK
jgi:exopolysaccharide production protein ExoZ